MSSSFMKCLSRRTIWRLLWSMQIKATFLHSYRYELCTGHVSLKCCVARQERKKLQEDVARWFFQQLIFGLDYCHRKGVANRDIKLENVLLHSGNRLPLVKLCDFGYSKHEDWDSAPR